MSKSLEVLSSALREFKSKTLLILDKEGFESDCQGGSLTRISSMLQCIIWLLEKEYIKELEKSFNKECTSRLSKEQVSIGYTDNGMDISYGDKKIEVPWDDIKQQILFREGVPV